MPDDTFTYISEAWHSTSWLDHCVCTADAHASLSHIDILYSYATSDHIPLSISLNVDNIPAVVDKLNDGCTTRIDWSKTTEDDIQKYFSLTDTLLQAVKVPREALTCLNPNCKNLQH